MGDVPVIFLSAYGRDELIARAFDMGAVDYVVKPFSPTELAARIRAALRKRAASEPSEPYVLGDLTIDYAERRVTLAGRPLPLIAMEYRLLAEPRPIRYYKWPASWPTPCCGGRNHPFPARMEWA